MRFCIGEEIRIGEDGVCRFVQCRQPVARHVRRRDHQYAEHGRHRKKFKHLALCGGLGQFDQRGRVRQFGETREAAVCDREDVLAGLPVRLQGRARKITSMCLIRVSSLMSGSRSRRRVAGRGCKVQGQEMTSDRLEGQARALA